MSRHVKRRLPHAHTPPPDHPWRRRLFDPVRPDWVPAREPPERRVRDLVDLVRREERGELIKIAPPQP